MRKRNRDLQVLAPKSTAKKKKFAKTLKPAKIPPLEDDDLVSDEVEDTLSIPPQKFVPFNLDQSPDLESVDMELEPSEAKSIPAAAVDKPVEVRIPVASPPSEELDDPDAPVLMDEDEFLRGPRTPSLSPAHVQRAPAPKTPAPMPNPHEKPAKVAKPRVPIANRTRSKSFIGMMIGDYK